MISMTSLLCPSPSAPVFTNLKIHATPTPGQNNRPKISRGADTPNLEAVPHAAAQLIEINRFSDRHFWHEDYDKAISAQSSASSPSSTPGARHCSRTLTHDAWHYHLLHFQ
jgi:hypothetical protein